MRLTFFFLILLFLTLPLPFGGTPPVFRWAVVGCIGILGGIVSVSMLRRKVGMLGLGSRCANEVCLLLMLSLSVLAVITYLQLQNFRLVKDTLRNGLTAFDVGAIGRAHFTVNPSDTYHTFILFLSHAVLFVVTAYVVSKTNSLQRFLTWLVRISVVYIFYALLSYISGNQYVLWFPKVGDLSSLSGPFINRNGFAAFLNISIFLMIYMIIEHWRRRIDGQGFRYAYSKMLTRVRAFDGVLPIALFVAVSCLFLTQSRGGALSFFVAAGVMIVGFYRKQVQSRPVTLLLLPMALVVVVLLISGPALIERFINVSEASERQILYAEIFNILGRMPVNGYGLGTFKEVYAMHQGENTLLVYFARAHSEYLELLLSVGFPGFLLLLALLGYALVKILRCVRDETSRPVLMAVLVVILVHAIIDFPFQIPSVSYLFVAVIACFLSPREGRGHGKSILVEG